MGGGLVTGPGPEASIETCHSGLTSFPECTGFVSSRSCPGGCRCHPHFIRGDTEAQRGTEPSVICRTQLWSAGMALRSFGSLCPSPAGEASRARGLDTGLGPGMQRSEKVKTTVHGFTEKLSSPRPPRLAPPPLHPQAPSEPPGEITAGAFRPALSEAFPLVSYRGIKCQQGHRLPAGGRGGRAGPGRGRERRQLLPVTFPGLPAPSSHRSRLAK